MRDSLQRGSTTVESRLFRLLDTSGEPFTAALPGDFVLKYRRSDQATSTTITTVSGTIGAPVQNSLAADPDDASLYEFGIPNAAKASGRWVKVSWSGTGIESDLMLFDLIVFDRLSSSVDVSSVQADAIDAAAVASDAITKIQNGLSTFDASANSVNVGSVAGSAVASVADFRADVSGLATAANLATVAEYLDTEIASILGSVSNLETGVNVSTISAAALNAIDTQLAGTHGAGSWTTGAGGGGSSPTVDEIATEVLSRIGTAHGTGSYVAASATEIRGAVGLTAANLESLVTTLQTGLDGVIKSGESRTLTRAGQNAITFTETREQ